MTYDLVCLSQLDWELAVQRPQHVLRCCARERRVFFIQKPHIGGAVVELEWSEAASGVIVVRPQLPERLVFEHREVLMRGLLMRLCMQQKIEDYVLWYYTPMALGFTRQLTPLASVYDRTDDLPIYPETSSLLRERERQLLEQVELVFTDSRSPAEAGWRQHPNVYAFPSNPRVGASRDSTWQEMRALIDAVIDSRRSTVVPFRVPRAVTTSPRTSRSKREYGRLLPFPSGVAQRTLLGTGE